MKKVFLEKIENVFVYNSFPLCHGLCTPSTRTPCRTSLPFTALRARHVERVVDGMGSVCARFGSDAGLCAAPPRLQTHSASQRQAPSPSPHMYGCSIWWGGLGGRRRRHDSTSSARHWQRGWSFTTTAAPSEEPPDAARHADPSDGQHPRGSASFNTTPTNRATCY
jgi:hypothetical protein